jgi:hypothetical protein
MNYWKINNQKDNMLAPQGIAQSARTTPYEAVTNSNLPFPLSSGTKLTYKKIKNKNKTASSYAISPFICYRIY